VVDPVIESLRQRQVKNFLCLLFLSQGTPMLLMGDEVSHSRAGNNNPWCQDNELNWFDWEMIKTNSGLLQFTKHLAQLTAALPIYNLEKFWAATNPERTGDISWHGLEIDKPDWTDESRCLAFALHRDRKEPILHVMLNAGNKDREFEAPAVHHPWSWDRIVDTSQPNPKNIQTTPGEPSNFGDLIRVRSKSTVVLQVKTSNP